MHENVISELIKDLDKINMYDDVIQLIKPKYLGKNGLITQCFNQLASMTIDDKRIHGPIFNDIRKNAENIIQKKIDNINEVKISLEISSETIDGTVPVEKEFFGKMHPISYSIKRIKDIFHSYGFCFVDAPEVETQWFNFTALNIPEHHPARQMHDTFYLESEDLNSDKYVLRTHTSNAQIRTMLKADLPLFISSCGKVYRYDLDATHSPMFHQVEMLAVDTNLNMGHLKYLIKRFLSDFFERDIEIRLRPSFFPFTEPSAEIDVGYTLVDDKIVIGGSERFLEIAGCGVVDPSVFKNVNIDDKYTGIAFGFGVERLAMLKYGVNDIRDFVANDMKWLRRNGFHFCSI